MSARFAYKVMSLVVLFSLAFQPLTVMGKQVDLETSRQGVGASAPETGLYRTTVTVDSPARRARLDALGVTVLADAPGQAIVLADADQLETLARLRFEPHASDDADALIAYHATAQPALAAAWGEVRQRMAANAQMAGAALVSLSTPALSTALASLTSIDDDADGLTNTEEAWWCTDPLNPDTDADGRSDGAEIQALKDWMGNTRAGPPGETPWPNWPMSPTSLTCPDKDSDSIPNMAERWELGLNMDLESSDRDKFDDGQELFGVTYCPGSGTGCGYGALPPASNDPNIVMFPNMPSFVKAPGNHPLVAAFPVPEVDVVESSLKVQTVTEVTTDHVISKGTEKSYSTAKTEGTSTGVANTVTWNNWQEQSIATTMPLASSSSLGPQDETWDKVKVAGAVAIGIAGGAAAITCVVATLGACGLVGVLAAGVIGGAGAGMAYGDVVVNKKESAQQRQTMQQIQNDIKKLKEMQSTCKSPNLANYAALAEATRAGDQQANPQGIDGALSCAGNTGPLAKSQSPNREQPVTGTQDRSYGDRRLTGNTSDSRAFSEQYYQLQYPLSQPTQTTTNTSGRSWGGAQTTTTEKYEEHTITEGEAFSNEEAWGNATAQDSAHAADLWFTYKVRNAGTEYAREIGNLAFNVYLGDDPNPIYTYFVGPDLGGDGKFHNFMPGEEHEYSSRANNHAIPLTLEQMKAIEVHPFCKEWREMGRIQPYDPNDPSARCPGSDLRIVVEDFTYGADELFYQDAANAGVLLAMEDGTDDGDEAIDTYLIPTWGDETVLDVLGRYFPHTTDENGMLVAVWTPEYRADTPAWCVEPQVVGLGSQRTLWCKHALSTADWWNVYTDGMGDGSEGFQDAPAAAGQTALFRFNQDTDLDGYSDRSEEKLGTDPNDPASYPKPELIAGLHTEQDGNNVVATLSLLNTGVYDAYGVEAVMIAPDDTISITNNTVGGSGRVRAQKQVIVGSRIVPQTPLPAAWLAAGHAKPAAGGYYTGATDLTYTFTAADSGSVGAGTLRLNWNDGAGGSGTLNFGAGYLSPNLINASNGVKLGLLSGTVNAGESFTIAATTPRDTFQYTIAPGHESDFTPPVVLVSYNDPQGNHRFGIPPAAANLGLPSDNLMAFSGQMQQEPGVEIVTTAAASVGANTTNLVVNNPTATTFTNAHLFLEFVDITGTVTLEVPVTTNLPPGPNVVSVDWSTVGFSPAYDPAQDYIVMAFWTDYQGNILDTAARPLSSFQADPKPAFAMADADATWDFGTAAQGTLLKRNFTFANTGALDLLTYVSAPAGLTVSQTGSRRVGMADMTTYEMALNTANLGVGPYSGDITIRTSDPDARERTVHVVGTVTAAVADTPVGAMQRPLDWPAPVSGTQGQWVDFAHTLGPEPLSSLHPVKVYSQDYSTLKGVGKYATAFGQGTASYDMFGDGLHGDAVIDTTRPFATAVTRLAIGSTATAGQNVVYFESPHALDTGNEILLIQMQGTGAGAYEFARIVSHSGQQYTLQDNLKNTYTQDATSSTQAVFVHRFHDVTVKPGVQWFAPAWDGNSGGIIVFRASGVVTVNGGITADGTGFRGGGQENCPTYCGEGTAGPSQRQSAINGNGAGGASEWDCGGVPSPLGGGGGGGNGTQGSNGAGNAPGHGGNTAGTPDLISIVLGGGGSGGLTVNNGHGRDGGGIIFIASKTINVGTSGSVSARGKNGDNATADGGGGGGGAGGSILVRAQAVSLGTTQVVAPGGSGGNGSGGSGRGGDGGIGRIRIEYCDTLSGSTNPSANTQKLNCYIVEQIESSPYDRARLNLPESGSHTYQVQYGRKLNWGGAANQVTSLRVPAGLFTAVTLQALVGDLPSNASFALDVGATGSDSWNGTVGNGGEYTSPNLAAFFNAYWAGHGAPTTGYLDVPIRVTLDRAGQVLLTNLQVTPTGSKLRAIRLPVRPQGYSSVTASFTVSGGAGPLAVGVDVGGDGSVDWTTTGSPAYPASLTTGNLAAAVNAYLVGKPDPTDVPIRFYLSPFATLNLTGFTATPVGQADAAIGAGDVTFSNGTPTETDTVTVNATIHNNGALETGPLTAAFYAIRTTQYADYIGSAFVPSVPPSSPSSVSIPWNTLGFTGTVPVRVVVDPYNRVAESNETNNVVTATVTIRTRPDLSIPTIALSDAEPMAGETVTVTVNVRNAGQTVAGTATVALYDGNPDAGGALVGDHGVGDHGGSPLPGGVTASVAFTWTATSAGPHRLFARADRDHQVAESDEGNNDRWRDVYVGFRSPIDLDSGGSTDVAYTSALGRGYLNADSTIITYCGAEPEQTSRSAAGGRVEYRFDHLLPGHFYHLDLVLYECDGLGRQERVLVNGFEVAAPVSLGDGQPHRLSIRLDPALYVDRTITALIEEVQGNDAIVSTVALHDIDYRYADAGGGNDPQYSSAQGYGWLDGVVQKSWGALPYQSRRIDLGDTNPSDDPDNEVRYQFDNLQRTRRYKLLLTFYNRTTPDPTLQVTVDGVRVTGQFVVPYDQRLDQEIAVPPPAYAGDGSIVVGIIRTNAQVGGFVNEIALEEVTLPRTKCNTLDVRGTPYITHAYGTVTIAGSPAPTGSLVEALSPRGDVVGCFVVQYDGLYGFLPIYGEDLNATPPIPGLRDGETVRFRVGGQNATGTPLLAWHDDKDVHEVTLAIGEGQQQIISLHNGWNLISFRLQPASTAVRDVLHSIDGQYDMVIGEDGTFVPGLPEQFQSLKEMLPGKAYWIRVTAAQGATLSISGTPVAPTTPITLRQGWRWLGYLPDHALPITIALQSIAGQYDMVLGEQGTYVVGLPDQFQTLREMQSGKGYLIRMKANGTLVYPAGTTQIATSPMTKAPASACGKMQNTPYMTLAYGDARVAGQPARAGTVVEAVTSRGDVAGCFIVTQPGYYGVVQVYGEDANGGAPGFRNGEPIRWRVDGVWAAGSAELTWADDREVHQVAIQTTGSVRPIFLPLVIQ